MLKTNIGTYVPSDNSPGIQTLDLTHEIDVNQLFISQAGSY